MDEREADTRYDRLVADLGTLHEELAEDGQTLWADWMASARRQILAHDGNGLSYLLGAYGGMGSFNDLQLSRQMQRLRSSVYDDAAALLSDLNSPDPSGPDPSS